MFSEVPSKPGNIHNSSLSQALNQGGMTWKSTYRHIILRYIPEQLNLNFQRDNLRTCKYSDQLDVIATVDTQVYEVIQNLQGKVKLVHI